MINAFLVTGSVLLIGIVAFIYFYIQDKKGRQQAKSHL